MALGSFLKNRIGKPAVRFGQGTVHAVLDEFGAVGHFAATSLTKRMKTSDLKRPALKENQDPSKLTTETWQAHAEFTRAISEAVTQDFTSVNTQIDFQSDRIVQGIQQAAGRLRNQKPTKQNAQGQFIGYNWAGGESNGTSTGTKNDPGNILGDAIGGWAGWKAIKRLRGKIGGAGKGGFLRGAGRLGGSLLGGALSAYSEYEDTGSASRATGAGIGGTIGTDLGGTIGSLADPFLGPLGTLGGMAIGGYLGHKGGASLGGLLSGDKDKTTSDKVSYNKINFNIKRQITFRAREIIFSAPTTKTGARGRGSPSMLQMALGSGVRGQYGDSYGMGPGSRDQYGGGVDSYGTGEGTREQYGGSPYGVGTGPRGTYVGGGNYGPGTGARGGTDSFAGLGTAPTGSLTASSSGKVNPSDFYNEAVKKFKDSPLNGYVPKDGAKWGIIKGTPEEWARLAVATAKQESGFNANAPGGGLLQMEGKDLANYGYRGANVGDPNAQLGAMVNEWSKHIIADGVVAAPGAGPRGGWGGAGRYFGSMRYGPGSGHGNVPDIDKYMQKDSTGQSYSDRVEALAAGRVEAAGGAGASNRLPPINEKTPDAYPPGTDLSGRADFFRKRGDAPIYPRTNDPRLTTITEGNKSWQVNKEAAPYFQTFLDKMKAAGAPIESEGGWVYREKTNGNGLSEHAWGGAIDAGQSGMGGTRDNPKAVSPQLLQWIRQHPKEFQDALDSGHIYSGERFGDLGHFEWGGVPYSKEELKQLGQDQPTRAQQGVPIPYAQVPFSAGAGIPSIPMPGNPTQGSGSVKTVPIKWSGDSSGPGTFQGDFMGQAPPDPTRFTKQHSDSLPITIPLDPGNVSTLPGPTPTPEPAPPPPDIPERPAPDPIQGLEDMKGDDNIGTSQQQKSDEHNQPMGMGIRGDSGEHKDDAGDNISFSQLVGESQVMS